MEKKDQLKFVIADENDYDFARKFISSKTWRAGSARSSSRQYSASCTRGTIGMDLRDGLRVRLGLQIHKFIWDPETRGV